LTEDREDHATEGAQQHGDSQQAPTTEAALASAQRLVSAAERFQRDSQDDGPEAGSDPAGTGGDRDAPLPVPGKDSREDDASGAEDPGIIPWMKADESARTRRRGPAPGGEQPAPDEPGVRPATSTDLASTLTPELLLGPRHRVPPGGWRRTVYRSTLGLVRVPPSRFELRRMELTVRARTAVASGHRRVAILSMKGGVGKTTTTVALGLTLASLRSDRIIAVDANPERGTLADKLTSQPRTSIRDLLEHYRSIERYADVRKFTSQTASRLEVLTSDENPAAAAAFSEDDYRAACNLLERFYSVCLTDCGTGLMHSAMTGVLGLADQIILVTTPSVDSARSAAATVDWLSAHGHHDLARDAVVVLNAVRRTGGQAVDVDVLAEQFAARCRAVVRVPYDAYLQQGATVELDQLAGGTADAFLQLAAEVGEGFARRRTELQLSR